MKTALVQLLAFAALAFATPAAAQIGTVDPDTGQQWQQQPMQDLPPPTDAQTPLPGEEAPPPVDDQVWTPLDTAPDASVPQDPAPIETRTAPPGETLPREDIFSAAEDLFGRGAEGLGGILEDILKDQGEPVAYISGQEAGGAFIVGVRYGSGVMRHRTEGDRVVYWTGPSIGFDVGADASKVFVLVYNLRDAQQLFRAYPSGEGRAYFVGGFSANYLRRGDVVLIPVRLGVGVRLGINAGYMRFSERNRWLPF